MGKKIRLSVRLSLETPEDVAFLATLSEVPAGRRNRWLRMRALVGFRIPENGIGVPEPLGEGRLLRVDLADDTPEERDLAEAARRDFYPGQTLRACLLRGGRTGTPASGGAPPAGSADSGALLPGSGSVKDRLRGLL